MVTHRLDRERDALLYEPVGIQYSMKTGRNIETLLQLQSRLTDIGGESQRPGMDKDPR